MRIVDSVLKSSPGSAWTRAAASVSTADKAAVPVNIRTGNIGSVGNLGMKLFLSYSSRDSVPKYRLAEDPRGECRRLNGQLLAVDAEDIERVHASRGGCQRLSF